MKMKRVLSLALILALTVALLVAVYAVDPNFNGIAISSPAEIVLNKDMEPNSRIVTVTMTVYQCTGIQGTWSATAGNDKIQLKKVETSLPMDQWDYIEGGMIMWDDSFAGPASGTITATYEIPFDMPAGEYQVTFTCEVLAGKDYEVDTTERTYTATIKVKQHAHTHAAYGKDENNHWSICACGYTFDSKLHNFTNGDCVCGEKKPGMLGDLDGDASVTAKDLTLLARHIAGIEYLVDQALLNADVDGNGQVNAEDLTCHARYIAGIITEWP